uniref:E3 ubiquitin-protein ligase TRIM39-like n=1 Tax=Leptobrachium leishanense TaxID=445787 RepID=A0A8C5N563_9ANUR
MASADLRDELSCSNCLNVYTDPVTLPCGHSFCKTCIGDVLGMQEVRENSCPECMEMFSIHRELNRNLTLHTVSESFQSAHQTKKRIAIPCTNCIQSPVPAVKTCLLCEASLCEDHLRVHSKSAEHVLTEPTTSLGNRKCLVHKKVLEYYCCEDAACICVYCRLDGEHRGHQVETLNEASEKKKEKLRNILQKLTSQREEAEKRVQSLEDHKKQVQKKAAEEAKEVTALIRDIREHLEVLERRVLSEISRQEEQVSLRVSDLIRQLKIKKEERSRKMGDIEELCDLTDPVTVLQEWESDRPEYCDAEEDTERHDIKVHDVGDLAVGLISVTLHSGLAEIVTREMRRRRVTEASDMLLDVNTASDMLLDVNTASDTLLDVNTASDMLLDVNTASDTLLDVNTASDMLLDVNTASDMLLDVNTASDMLLDVNTASDTLLDVNTASDTLLDVNTASDTLLDVNTASDTLLDVNTASDTLLDVNTASDTLLDVNTASDTLLGVNTASDMLLDVNTASDMLLDVNTASDMLLDVNTASDMLLDVNTASDMLLDVNTAGNGVSVSEDLKTVSWSETNQNHLKTPERFHCPQVLSSSSFSSGRHYWEVEGSESGGWGVGMTYPSIERRGKQSVIGDNKKSWGLERYRNKYLVAHDSKLIKLRHPPSCHRFRISLDYEVGRLSFYELCDPIRHLHTFTAAFTEPLHAGIRLYGANTWVRI